MKCEHCDDKISHVLQSHSLVAVLQKIDQQKGYSWYQCLAGPEVDTQHCYCSEQHMIDNAGKCIQEHYTENNLVTVPIEQVRLHTFVFARKPLCKVCQAPLTATAYRFCLTHATPIIRLLDESHDEMGEWCCSLEHAKQSALAVIAGIGEDLLVNRG